MIHLCDVVIIAVILLISQQIEYIKDMTMHLIAL